MSHEHQAYIFFFYYFEATVKHYRSGFIYLENLPKKKKKSPMMTETSNDYFLFSFPEVIDH